jgi:hypothetical protein
MALELNIQINGLPSAKPNLRYTIFDEVAGSTDPLVIIGGGNIDVPASGAVKIPFDGRTLGSIVGVRFDEYDGTNRATSKGAQLWLPVTDNGEVSVLTYAPKFGSGGSYIQLAEVKTLIDDWYISFDVYVHDNTVTGGLISNASSTSPIYVYINGSTQRMEMAFRSASGTWTYIAIGDVPVGLHSVLISYNSATLEVTSVLDGGTPSVTGSISNIARTILYIGRDWYPKYSVVSIYNLDLNGDFYSLTKEFKDYPDFTSSLGNVAKGVNLDVDDIVLINEDNTSSPIDKTPYMYDIKHFLTYGQSLSVGAVGTPVISTTQPYSNLTFQGGVDGGTTGKQFFPLSPLVEVAASSYSTTGKGETPCSGMANYYSKLIENGGGDPDSYVILSTAAGKAGYSLANLQKGSAWYAATVPFHIEKGMYSQNSYTIPMVHWMQGESDSDTEYQDYYDRLLQLFADIQADYEAATGNTNQIIFVTYQSYGNASSATGRAMSKAQLDLVRDHAHILLSSPVYHLEISEFPHLTAEAYYRLGAYAARTYYNHVNNGDSALPINPVSAVATGTNVKVSFDVVNPPLLINTTDITSVSNYGFALTHNGASVTINSVAIGSDGVSVELNTSTTLSGVISVGYVVNNQLRGNITDSNSDTVLAPNGNTVKLFNVCPMFTMEG